MVEDDNATATFGLCGVGYIDFLNALHTHLATRNYLEVGGPLRLPPASPRGTSSAI